MKQALINQMEAGTDLDDMKITQLTDSIQGLFEAESVASKSVRKQEMSSEMSSASFLINQREAGLGLDDKKMVQLTDSIQGLFDAKSLALAASQAKVASKLAAPKVQKTV